MKNLAAILGACALATSAAAQQPGIQQQFEAATEALNAQKWVDAVSAFEALEPRLAKNARSLAIVRVRKGTALFELRRDAEAAAAVKAGLAALPAGDASLREDRFLALMLLGNMDGRALDYASALARYREAEHFADAPQSKVRALVAMVQSGTFLDPDAALANADRLQALVVTLSPDKAAEARFADLKGRVLLNLGRFKDAQEEFGRSVKALGGLSLRVDQDDVIARSDYAIAAMLAGDEDRARNYLAYTGAGRLPKDGLGMGPDTPAPPCGGPDGLQPDDVGVVEFGIADDGSVVAPRPIYSSRRGTSALEFARAVADWSWAPEKVKDIPPLFRMLTRIEMRCSTVSARPSIPALLRPGLNSWLSEKAVDPVSIEETSNARRLPLLVAELARREAAQGASALQLMPVLAELASSPVLGANEALVYARRALTIADASQVPPVARLYLSHLQWKSAAGADRNAASYLGAIEAAMQDERIRKDAVARAALRLMLVDSRGQKWNREDEALLRSVIDDDGLAASDPFRVGALIRLASQQFRQGDDEAARATFKLSGLSSEQCALVDAPPALKKGSISDSDFPQEALTWGFSGWTSVQFDIAADGKTMNHRALFAYPPFVFGDVTAGYFRRFEYEPSYRPGQTLGCGGKMQRVTYRHHGG